MPGLSIRRIDKPDRTVLLFSGALDETVTLRWDSFADLKEDVSIHLRRLARINSCGVREWINFCNAVPAGMRLTLEQCSIPFMAQAEKISNFVGTGRVRSCMVDLTCPRCEGELERLVVLDRTPFDESAIVCPCPSCGAQMNIDGPSPSAILTDLAVASEQAAELRPSPLDRSSLVSAMQSLFGGSVIPVALVDSEDRLVYVNEEWEQFFGWRGSLFENQRLAEHVRFEIANEARDLISECRRSGKTMRWREVRVVQVPTSNIVVELTPLPEQLMSIRLIDLTVEALLHEHYRHLWNAASGSYQLIGQLKEKLADQWNENRESRSATSQYLR